MADDDSDDTSDSAATGKESGGEASTRVARVRYVRSGWGALFAVGVVAGVVVATGDVADFDTDPFCAEVVVAASATTVTTAAPAPGAVAVPGQQVDLAAARARLAQYEAYLGTLPYELEDDLDLLIERERRLVVAIEELGPDATRDQLDAAIVEADAGEGRLVGEAIFALDSYAASACDLGPELVD